MKTGTHLVFEYKSETEMYVVLMQAQEGGAIELDKWVIPVREIERIHESLSSFDSLFRAGILKLTEVS